MKSDEELWQICLEIYNELYEEATPSADFNNLKDGKFSKNNDSDDEQPFRDYYLDQDRQDKILQKHVEKHNLTDAEKQKISTEIHLGAAPVGTKKAWRDNQ